MPLQPMWPRLKMVPMRLDVPNIEHGVALVQSMCQTIAECKLIENQTTINILGEDEHMMFFKKQLTEHDCYVLDEAPDSLQTQYFLSNREHVGKLIRDEHPILRDLQEVFHASRHTLELCTPDDHITLVTVSEGATFNVPRMCLVFVAMLKHHHKLKAWAVRAREAANAPGGAAARAAVERNYDRVGRITA